VTTSFGKIIQAPLRWNSFVFIMMSTHEGLQCGVGETGGAIEDCAAYED